MRLQHLLNKKVYIARNATVSGMKTAMLTVTAEMAHINPIGAGKSQIEGGAFGQSARFYFESDADVQQGDRFRDNDNNYYTVITGGVVRRTFGSMDFLEVDTIKH